MKENKILASVALFSELYNNNKDIYDVLVEFIKAAIISESKWVLNSTEATQLLEEVFDFKIPEAVVKTTLKNRLNKNLIISHVNGVFTINPTEIQKDNNFSIEYDATKNDHSKIIDALFLYVELKESKTLSESEKEDLKKSLNSYLLDYETSAKYSKYISSFIIENQKTSNFTDCLNAIKEGLVIYTGIRFTADLNDLGSWNSELTIFLDTEHLFNSAGLNGLIYEEIFNDFFKLVQDINNSNKNKTQKNKIELRYFEENNNEIENFFHVAEKILEGKAVLDPSKPAMQAIVNGCKTPSDVIQRKNKFLQDLKIKGIKLEDKIDYYKDHSFNVEDDIIIGLLKKQAEERNKNLNEEECRHYLKLFTKINVLRKGISNNGFERVGCILLTGKTIAHVIAHNNLVKNKGRDIPFTTDIDFITDKFWFKLKKGFNDKNSLPKSFDIITKAQIVLSSQINNSVSQEYNLLTLKYKRGEITKDEAISLNHELRGKVSKPEDIVPEIIDDSLTFLNENNVEKHLREKSILLKKAEEGDKYKNELERLNRIEKIKKRKPKRIFVKTTFWFFVFIVPILYVFIFTLISTWLYFLKRPGDTRLATLASLFTIIAPLISIIPPLSYGSRIYKWFKSRVLRKYKIMIKGI